MVVKQLVQELLVSTYSPIKMCSLDYAAYKLYEPYELSDPDWESEIASEIEIPAQSNRQTRPSSANQQVACDRGRKSRKNCKHTKIKGSKKKACAECFSLHRRCTHNVKTKPARPTNSNRVPKPSSYAPPRVSPDIETGDEEGINRENVVTVAPRASPRTERGYEEEVNRENVVTAAPRPSPRVERGEEEEIIREQVVTAAPRASQRVESGEEEEINREQVVTMPLGKAIRLAERNKLVQILQSLCEGNRLIADRVIQDLLNDAVGERQASNRLDVEHAPSMSHVRRAREGVRNVAKGYQSTKKRAVAELIPTEDERTNKRQRADPDSPATVDTEDETRRWHRPPQKAPNHFTSLWETGPPSKQADHLQKSEGNGSVRLGKKPSNQYAELYPENATAQHGRFRPREAVSFILERPRVRSQLGRRLWTKEEEQALLAGLERARASNITGVLQWRTILLWYGAHGTINQCLKDYKPEKLRRKARDLMEFCRSNRREPPACLSWGVNGV